MLAAAIARCVVKSMQSMKRSDLGPTGFMQDKTQRTTAWGAQSASSGGSAVSLLNEDVVVQRHVLLNATQSALDLHVDDTVTFSLSENAKVHADTLMEVVAEGLEQAGFKVPDRSSNASLAKVIGYACDRREARFSLVPVKWVLLREALLEQYGQPYVDVAVIHSLVGLWLFAALLNRDMLCIPHSIFHFIDFFQSGLHKWWKSARDEIWAMGQVTPLLTYKASAPWAPTAFATDAMGPGGLDKGGYGIVARAISPKLRDDMLSVGMAPGRTVARLKGDLTGLKYPKKEIVTTVPFTRLSDDWFVKNAWRDVAGGRWKFDDHIVLGEARALCKLCSILSNFPKAQGFKVGSLQDNMSVAGAHAKGRSTAWALNRILRRKAALTTASAIRMFLPWVQTTLQMADELSRRKQ
jgi:hypothetical protein